MGVLKKLTKPFKKIAKKIKKVAGKVMGGIMKIPGFKQLGSLYGKTFGKLGPLGAIAASFVLPGLGSMISSAWTGALTGNFGAIIQTAAKGLQTFGNGISQFGTGITDRIAGAWTEMGGGELTKGISDTFQKASDWVTGGKSPADFSIGAPSSMSPAAQQAMNANPELIGAANAQARNQFASITGAQKAEALMGSGMPTEIASQMNQQQIANQFAQTPGLANKTLLQTTGKEMANVNILGREVAKTMPKSGGFAKKALKGAASMLLDNSLAPIDTSMASIGKGSLDAFGTNRIGAGGVGATGGQFLTPQQQAFFQQHASLLGQQG